MNKSFLLGTHSGLYHLQLDETLEPISCKQVLTGHHYGLSIDLSGKKVYSKNQDEYFNVLDLGNLQLLNTIPFRSNPGHVHQALHTGIGILLTDTLHNRLTLQLEDGACEHFVVDGTEEDLNHLNSIFIFENEIACLLHNRGNQPTEVLILSYSTRGGFSQRRRWHTSDNGCHNLFLNQGSLYYNASVLGHFVRLDIETRSEISRLKFKGHTKGLSVTGRNIFIGVSDHAVREERKHTASSIIVIDRSSLKVQAEILVKTDEGKFIGNINEVRCISEPDYSEGAFD
jgi:hypothetical protein